MDLLKSKTDSKLPDQQWVKYFANGEQADKKLAFLLFLSISFSRYISYVPILWKRGTPIRPVATIHSTDTYN